MNSRLQGLGVALVTPFLENGEVDYDALVRLVDHVSDGGVDYLVVLGTTGETPTLENKEKNLIFETVKKANKKNLPIVLGMGGNATDKLIRQIKAADLDGVDAILSVAPYYNRPSQQGLYEHYKAVAEAAPCDVILYNVPGRTGVNLLPDTAIRLANECKNIIAIKEASGKIEQFDEQLNDEIAIPLDEKSNYRAHTLVDGKGNETYVAPAAEELYRWRLWETTSAGVMAELGSHQLDAAGIFIAAMYGDGKHHHPINVTAFANRSVFNKRKDANGNYVLLNDRDIEDHMTCVYEYAAPGYDTDPRQKVAVAYSAINGNDFGGYGEVVMGTTGALQIDREENAYLWYTYEINQYAHVERGGESKVTGFKAPEFTLKPTSDDDFPKNQKMDEVLGTEALHDLSLGYTEEIEHFAWCIRKNPEPNYKTDDPKLMMHCQPKVAMADAIMALTANISARVGQTINFKDEWFDVFNDATPENDYRPEGAPEIKPTEPIPAGFGNVPAEPAPAPAPAPAEPAPAPTPAPAAN